MAGNTGISPEIPSENTGYHSLAAQIIARQQLVLLGLSRAQVAAGLSAPTNFFRASGIVANLMLHVASPEARVGPPSEAYDSGLPYTRHILTQPPKAKLGSREAGKGGRSIPETCILLQLHGKAGNRAVKRPLRIRPG